MPVLIFAAALLLAPPANPAPNTLNEITTRGMIITQQGYDITIEYSADGRFTAAQGLITGTWRIEGDKLCTTSNLQPKESCVEYPKGLKSGDSFDGVSPEGVPTHVRIR